MAPGKNSAQSRRRVKAGPAARRQSDGANQKHQVATVTFGNQPGASQASVATVQTNGMLPPTSQHQATVSTQLINPPTLQHYQTYQMLNAPRQATQRQAPLPSWPQASGFYEQLLSDQRKALPASRDGQQQKSHALVALANFYTPNSRPDSLVGVQSQAVSNAQTMNGNQLQPSASSIMRRSVSFAAPSRPQPVQFAPQVALPSKGGKSPAGRDKDVYLGAASGVIARKLYKPPSEDDPFHTLSYSSQTGRDPDMDQDEDDSVVMGSDGGGEQQPDSAASSSSKTGQSERRNRPAQSRSRVTSFRGTLSERERAALMDPNHDDTDPVIDRNVARRRGQEKLAIAPSWSSGAGDRRRASNGRGSETSEEEGNRLADSDTGESDADENDADLTDETRASQTRHTNRRADNKNRARIAPPVSGPGASGHSPPRFGKSFKFEHELSRLGTGDRQEPGGEVAAQLRQLKPGLQGYVSGGSREGGRLQRGPLETASQLKSLAATIGRRSDDDEDGDDDDDGEADENGSSPQGRQLLSARGSGRHQVAASARDDDDSSEEADNPDADPEFNPRESHLPAHSKPKRFEKSFAYVHRDLPKKGSRNPDDFVVSYGRGNLQTEHEDYDSDRDNSAAGSQEDPSASGQQERATSASSGHLSYSRQEPLQMNRRPEGGASLFNVGATKRYSTQKARSLPLLRNARAIQAPLLTGRN